MLCWNLCVISATDAVNKDTAVAVVVARMCSLVVVRQIDRQNKCEISFFLVTSLSSGEV